MGRTELAANPRSIRLKFGKILLMMPINSGRPVGLVGPLLKTSSVLIRLQTVER